MRRHQSPALLRSPFFPNSASVFDLPRWFGRPGNAWLGHGEFASMVELLAFLSKLSVSFGQRRILHRPFLVSGGGGALLFTLAGILGLGWHSASAQSGRCSRWNDCRVESLGVPPSVAWESDPRRRFFPAD